MQCSQPISVQTNQCLEKTFEKSLYPDKLLSDTTIQIRPNKNRISKGPGLMLSDDFPAPREELGKKDPNTTCLFPGRQFKYPMGAVLRISWESSSFGGLPER